MIEVIEGSKNLATWDLGIRLCQLYQLEKALKALPGEPQLTRFDIKLGCFDIKIPKFDDLYFVLVVESQLGRFIEHFGHIRNISCEFRTCQQTCGFHVSIRKYICAGSDLPNILWRVVLQILIL